MSGSPQFVFRDARPEDVPAILALWKAAEATESVTDGPAALMAVVEREDAFVLLAEIDGQIVGSTIGTFDGWRGNVYRLAVHPGHRRRGVARELVAMLDERFAARGVKRVTALVEKAHPSAVAFWDSTSYFHDERTIRYVRTVHERDTHDA